MLDAMSKGEYHEARSSTPVVWRITMITGPKKVWKTLKKPESNTNGVLKFATNDGQEISVPESAVLIEKESPSN
jgi:hypothetical protein